MMFILLMAPFCVIAGPALDSVKTNVIAVLDVLKDPKLKGPSGKKAKEQKIEVIADKMFDYVELSKRTLGLNWNKFTVDQRKEFVELFKSMLRDTYIDRITAYTQRKDQFYERGSPLRKIPLRSRPLLSPASAQTPINYRL